jgi:UDP-N-acetylmuramyl-tripeptide synthetase
MDTSISSAPTHDSRQVTPGGLFVAIPGQKADGATFISSAAERGAAAVLCEQQVASNVPLVVVRNARAALAVAAAWWEGDPAEELVAIGVTGTDGKTTTSTFLSTALTAAGLRTGLISTAISRIGGVQRAAAAHQTTPEAPALQRALREMVEAGDEAAVVESTSHGLQLERVGAIGFAAAIYTTFSPDHLDFHASLDAYRAAKAKLITRTVGSAASRAPLVSAPPGWFCQVVSGSALTPASPGEGILRHPRGSGHSGAQMPAPDETSEALRAALRARDEGRVLTLTDHSDPACGRTGPGNS